MSQKKMMMFRKRPWENNKDSKEMISGEGQGKEEKKERDSEKGKSWGRHQNWTGIPQTLER